MMWVGDEELFVCRPCLEDVVGAFRLVVNGLRRQHGLPPRKFKNFLR